MCRPLQTLQLEKYGVSYIDIAPYVSILHRDGNVLQWWADFEDTYRSFARLDKDDADRLRWWKDRFIPITRDILRPEAASLPMTHDKHRALLEGTQDGRFLSIGFSARWRPSRTIFRSSRSDSSLSSSNGTSATI
jgi:phytoene dehydrogenase-like protein